MLARGGAYAGLPGTSRQVIVRPGSRAARRSRIAVTACGTVSAGSSAGAGALRSAATTWTSRRVRPVRWAWWAAHSAAAALCVDPSTPTTTDWNMSSTSG
ncbi:hypothetical protein GCM10023235_69430 [Kitasatospora terrestris]|uniref:Uncharacterized protein n=1 Tax=Kitasatospora terrestris TaxID=258051 RepID=A0ABP9EHK0_9ACTN